MSMIFLFPSLDPQQTMETGVLNVNDISISQSRPPTDDGDGSLINGDM